MARGGAGARGMRKSAGAGSGDNSVIFAGDKKIGLGLGADS